MCPGKVMRMRKQAHEPQHQRLRHPQSWRGFHTRRRPVVTCPSFVLSIYLRPQFEETLPPTAFLFVCEQGSQRLMDTTRTAQAGPAVAMASLFISGL